MSLLSRFRALLRDAFADAAPAEEGELTVAALLVLVARIDGKVLDVEETGLRRLLRSRFGGSEEEVAQLLDAVGRMAAGADEVASLADRILHDVRPEERPHLLALAYRMAAIDGIVHEFEQDLIWRVGRLLGLSDDAVASAREHALRHLAPERARRA